MSSFVGWLYDESKKTAAFLRAKCGLVPQIRFTRIGQAAL